MRKRGAERGINDGRREGIPYYIIYRRPTPALPGRERERGGRKSGNGNLRVSESRGNAFTLPSVSRFKTTESD